MLTNFFRNLLATNFSGFEDYFLQLPFAAFLTFNKKYLVKGCIQIHFRKKYTLKQKENNHSLLSYFIKKLSNKNTKAYQPKLYHRKPIFLINI
jgi:hypothetical protein